MSSGRPVIVKQLPKRLVVGQSEQFYREVQPVLRAERPRLVFDFSAVQELDSSSTEMLLRCMEQALKENGDIKLASVPPGPAVILELTGVDRFFEVYPSVSDAVDSFHQLQGETWQRSWPNKAGTTEDELNMAS